jgi:hypothetical protein
MRSECGVGSLAWWLVRGEVKGREGYGVLLSLVLVLVLVCWGSADAARLRWLAFRGSCRTLACCHATSCYAMRCGAADCLCIEEVIVLRLVWRSWAAVWLCWAVLITSCVRRTDGYLHLGSWRVYWDVLVCVGGACLSLCIHVLEMVEHLCSYQCRHMDVDIGICRAVGRSGSGCMY